MKSKPRTSFLRATITGLTPGRARPLALALSCVLLTAYADRRDRYSLPVYPGMAWMAGMWLSTMWPRMGKCRRFVWRGLAMTAAALGVAFALVPVAIQERIDPQWPALFQWVRQQGIESDEAARPWAGGIAGAQAARLYLEFGWWPRTTRNRWGDLVAIPPARSTAPSATSRAIAANAVG